MQRPYWPYRAAIFTGSLVCLWRMGSQINAQPDPNNIPKAANPPTTQQLRAAQLQANKLLVEQRIAEREIAQLETMLGQTLTPAQKQAIGQAAIQRYYATVAIQKKHQESVAKALGITVEALAANQKAYLKLHPATTQPTTPTVPQAAAPKK
ncbi:MAG: hypothetical protein JO316_06380 [Abitibacteriaceae bacterium]|nr:hypothetical protein [Abditibacteriaceae bacterium]MBV9864958.1 hypothetical protein [Abditibacteriaceae bacterium]